MIRRDDADLVYTAGDGRRVELFAPVLGTTCTRCDSRLDDVCFLIRDRTGLTGAGGLCSPCLVDVLEPHARPLDVPVTAH